MPATTDGVWTGQDVHPDQVEAALRELVVERHQEDAGYVPERSLNLVCVVDKQYSGEVANRLRRVGRYHASRTVVCAIEPGRSTLDAVATIASDEDPAPHRPARLRETVVVTVGEQHVERLDSIVDPLVVTDLTTVVWSPHGHPEAVDVLLDLAQSVLHDALDEPDPRDALARAGELAERAYVVDLAWLRTTPWRERIAATFDPAPGRASLASLSAVTVRHAPGSEVSALLLLGWLASRLGWKPARLNADGDARRGRASARRQDVQLRLEPARMDVPGLAGITVKTAAGGSIALDRGPGGLVCRRRRRNGDEREWTILGASRGEGGILGEGIRQALLRDPTYAPAAAAARQLAG